MFIDHSMTASLLGFAIGSLDRSCPNLHPNLRSTTASLQRIGELSLSKTAKDEVC